MQGRYYDPLKALPRTGNEAIAALEADNARLRLEIGRLLRISEDFRHQLMKAWNVLDDAAAAKGYSEYG